MSTRGLEFARVVAVRRALPPAEADAPEVHLALGALRGIGIELVLNPASDAAPRAACL